MNMKQFLGTLAAMVVRIAVAAAIIIVVFRLAVSAYNFGYQIFADEPVSSGEGRTVSITITDDQSSLEVGKLLEQRGIIKNAYVFYIQERLSDYKDEIIPGTYDLSTAMNSEEILEVLCSEDDEGEEE